MYLIPKSENTKEQKIIDQLISHLSNLYNVRRNRQHLQPGAFHHIRKNPIYYQQNTKGVTQEASNSYRDWHLIVLHLAG